MAGSLKQGYMMGRVAHGRYAYNAGVVFVVFGKNQDIVVGEVVIDVFQLSVETHPVIDAAIVLPDAREREIAYAMVVLPALHHAESNPEMVVVDTAYPHGCLVEMEVAFLVVGKIIERHVADWYNRIVMVASVVSESVEHDDLMVEVVSAVALGDIVGAFVRGKENDAV